jgi:hypothetical protein
MQVQVHKLELQSLTEFQRDMHLVKGQEKITSPFYREYLKTTWYSNIIKPLESSQCGDNQFSYKPDPVFHFLMYTYLKFMLPAIYVKNAYKNTIRIAWCHNIGTNITPLMSFKEDDLDYQTWDSVGLDDYFQWFMEEGAGKRKNHKIGVGNTPYIEEWNDFLPAFPINVDQPWFYGEEPAYAFQLYTKSSQCRAEHIYTLRKNICDLLRMQRLEGDKWVNIQTKDYMQDYLYYGKSDEIETPVLWGRYAYVTDDELKSYKLDPRMQTREYYIKDMEICDADNAHQYGALVEVPLQCTHPCLAIFWKAENIKATQYNNYSNYTCHTDDLYHGWDPISHTTLKHGSKIKLNNMTSDHFNIAESRKHGKSAPCENGYHAHFMTWKSHQFHGYMGLSLSALNSKLSCKLAYQNIYEDDDQDKVNPEFMLRVRLLYVKKLVIKRENDSYQYTLI